MDPKTDSDKLPSRSIAIVDFDDIEAKTDRDWSVGPLGLTVHGKPSFESSERLGFQFSVLHEGLAWAIGDFLNYIEDRFGEQASQIVDVERFEESTIKVYRWVASKVPFENRRGLPMTFGHHQAVAALQPKQQRHWLNLAATDEKGPWKIEKLKAAIKSGSDIEPTSWIVQAVCETTEKRQSAVAKLESIGLSVKVIDRHTKKKTDVTARPKRAKKGAKKR